MNDGSSRDAVRLDRWLWAARAFRSRSLAQQACDGGKVSVNGAGAKPHKQVRAGDLVILTTPVGKRQLRVRATGERRGPASIAQSLYDELTPPTPRTQGLPARRERGAGRPTKRERRQIDRFRTE